MRMIRRASFAYVNGEGAMFCLGRFVSIHYATPLRTRIRPLMARSTVRARCVFQSFQVANYRPIVSICCVITVRINMRNIAQVCLSQELKG